MTTQHLTQEIFDAIEKIEKIQCKLRTSNVWVDYDDLSKYEIIRDIIYTRDYFEFRIKPTLTKSRLYLYYNGYGECRSAVCQETKTDTLDFIEKQKLIEEYALFVRWLTDVMEHDTTRETK